MAGKTVLFVAPSASVADHFGKLRERGFEVGVADTLSGAKAYIEKNPVLILSKARMPGYRVENLLGVSAEAMGDFPPIIVFTDSGTPAEAKKLMELGAADYWLEPLVWDRLEAALPVFEPDSDSLESSEPLQKTVRPQAAPEIIGRHPAMLRVLALARQVAASKATVLISGESGTGKEKFARFLHVQSDRVGKPFVAINCAALPEHLLESELFGHEKGSFTGAINRKLGKFELANTGTILLDEISEMELGLQAKLLRVLQEGEIDRVGGVETVKVDVRVLATTNRDIEEYVKDGKFRQDLFYRLNVIPLKLPALNERGDDVLLLATHFVKNFCKAYGLPKLEFSLEANKWLLEYEWPGNVRELQNLMERAVLLAGSGPIQTSHFLLDPDSWQPEEGQAEPASQDSAAQGVHLPDGVLRLEEMEKLMIIKSLDKTEGNRTQAADLLGISVRTLRNKLNEYKKQGLDL